MIVYKLVAVETGGRRVSLMSTGQEQVEYKPGEFAYPPSGVLYAYDSLERAEGYIWRCGVPTSVVELWSAEATDVVSVPPWPNLVGCKSLKLLEKLFPAEDAHLEGKEETDRALGID